MNWLAVAWLSAALAAWPQAAHAQAPAKPQPPSLCGVGPIRLAFYEYGFLYFHDGERSRGIDKEFVDLLQARSGCRFEVSVRARARIWADLAEGQLDMSVSGIRTPERDKFAWFAPYFQMKNMVLLRPGLTPAQLQADGFAQTPTLQFGVVRGFRHGDWHDEFLEPLRTQGRVQESANAEALFRKLAEGRIDALFSQSPVYRKWLTDLGLTQVQVRDWAPGQKGVAHGLILAKSRFTQAQARQWQELVGQIRREGTVAPLLGRYLPPDEVREMVGF